MGIVVVPSFGADPVTVTGPTLDAKVDGLATEFNGSIDNANIKAGAAIAYTKLNLTGLIRNADIKSDAAIDLSKIVATSQATGDTIYASSATVLSRLAKGTASQIFAMKSDASIPEWTSYSTFNTAANALAGSVVQVVNTQTGSVATGTTAIPYDNSAPAITEGDQYMTLAITPTSATNKLRIDVVCVGSNSASNDFTAALFVVGTSAALAAGNEYRNSTNTSAVCFTHYMTAGVTTELTFTVRAGASTGATTTFNGHAGAVVYGAAIKSSITITEIKA
jgi:hypothetical protein